MTQVGQAALSGVVFGLVMGVVIGLTKHDARAGLATGVLSAVLFGVAIGALGKLARPFVATDLDSGEALLHQGPANHFVGSEAVGGSLMLTSKRLRFRSHKINVQNHDQSLPIERIASIEPVKTLGLIPNGVVVHLRDGTKERFVVGNRSIWLTRVRKAIPANV